MASGQEFVTGWVSEQVLGEGTFGEVWLLVHAVSGACVALKAVSAEGAREAALHRALRHPHVLRCMGERRHGDLHFLFLEYAQGGELFDRIEPDSGMEPRAARRYWRQLGAGLGYLHGRGVAHRDLKPENLLLDHMDRLKISDFGIATVFRVGTKERLLARVCGTLPYVAPEVLVAPDKPYRAVPADLWSAALVLLVMLAGELPWRRAIPENPVFAAWSAGRFAEHLIWRKAGGAISLLRAALRPDPARRATLEELLADRWLAQDEPDEGARRACWSQPAGVCAGTESGEEGEHLSPAAMDAILTLSQPAHSDELLLPPESGPEQGEALQRMVKRVTRVWLDGDSREALSALQNVLRELRLSWRMLHPGVLAIECEADVRMRASVLSAVSDGRARTLLEFRRSRGCGLAFKRCFVQLRETLLARGSIAAQSDAVP